MKQYIGCDAHARYSIFVSMDETGKVGRPVRVEHDDLEMRRFLGNLPAGSPVALESSGNWYWLVRAMEEAGLEPRFAHALEVKKRLPSRNKTDLLDAKGLALLLRNGALPEVWIPPAKLLDVRDLMRTRLSIRQQGTLLKCRIHAALRRYGVRDYTGRPVRQEQPCEPGCGDRPLAAGDAHRKLTRMGTAGLLGSPDRSPRTANTRTRREPRLGTAAEDLAGRRYDSGLHDVSGDRGCVAFPRCRALGQLRGPGSHRARQRWQALAGTYSSFGESLSEVGVHRGRECHRYAAKSVGRPACCAPVSTLTSQ